MNLHTIFSIRRVLGICFVLLFSFISYGQDIVPLGKEIQSIDGPLSFFNLRTVIYEQADSNQKSFRFQPFFVFEADKNKMIKIKHEPLITPTMSQIKLNILISPSQLVGDMAAYIRKSTKIDKLMKVNATELISIPLKTIRIKQITQTGEEPIFMPFELSNGHYTAASIPLESKLLPSKEAEDLFNSVSSQKRDFTFQINYEFAAQVTKNQSSASANIITNKETNAVKELSGKGSELAFSKSETGFKKENVSLTRSQKEKFEGKLKREVSIRLIKSENSEDDKELKELLSQYLQTVLDSNTVDLNEKAFATEISKLAKYDFDPGDLKPDRITKIALDTKELFKSQTKEFN